MINDLIIIRPGSEVTLPSSPKAKATVLAAAIYPGRRVTYQVAWWEGRTRQEAWVESVEIAEGAPENPMKIGFTA